MMKTKLLFQLVTALNLVFAALPIQSALTAMVPSAAPESLLQFTAGGHVLGFAARGMYAASGSHALHVDFVDANAIQPKSGSPAAAADGQAAPLSHVTYANLWDEIDLTYTADAGAIYTTTYTLSPGADPADIRLRYNAPLTLNEDGTLRIEFETGAMTENAPAAWQEINGQRTPVDVSFRVSGQDVSFALGTYNPRCALTIDPTLMWNTFLGGSNQDEGTGLAVDGSGNIYVTGFSSDEWGSPYRDYTGGRDAFAAKFNTSGSRVWNTFLGGIGEDQSHAIAIDGSGNTYVTGYSDAAWGSPMRAYSGGIDAFAAKLDGYGALTWSTFLGGTAADDGKDIAVDGNGNVLVMGYSNATWGSPIIAYTGGWDAFAAKLNSAGFLSWNTFMGGSGDDWGSGIAVDGSGKAYVTGDSTAAWGSPVQAYAGGGRDAFAAKLDTAGSLTWNTFLGGSETDSGYGIAVDGSSNVYIMGQSYGTWGDPVRPFFFFGGDDAFAARLDSSGNLTWNTFLGGGGDDYGYGIVVDGSGNVFVSGFSSGTWESPVRAYTGGDDAFAAKLDSLGGLVWNTFLGGSGRDDGRGIAVDVSGNIYTAGSSSVEWGDPAGYPSDGILDAFSAKLDSAGSLIWNIFMGGCGEDYGYGIAVDGSGNVYVTGESTNIWGSPVRPYSVGFHAFVAKLDPSGNVVWNTFLGGENGADKGYSIDVDGSGNAYVTGYSGDTWGNPVRAYTDSGDAFAAKLNSAGNLIWNTFLGGIDHDYGFGIAVDGSGNVYVAGETDFIGWGEPVRAYSGGWNDGFAAKLDADGNLVWNTFLGGENVDYCLGIAVDDSGNIYVSGTSTSTWESPVRAFTGGLYDAFAAKLDPSGALVWNTFLGGGGDDEASGIAVDGSGNAYVTGYSSDAWGSPVRAYSGFWDAFTVKLDPSGNLAWNTFLGSSAIGEDDGTGIVVDGNGNVYVTGLSIATWGSPVGSHSGYNDAFAAKLDSSGALIWNTFLGGGSGYAIAVADSGNVYVTGKSSGTWGIPVRAYTGGFDAFVAKLTVAPPEAFEKTAPSNGTYASTNPTLTWDASSGAEEYEYCYDTSNNNTCDSSWVSTGTSTSVAISGLIDNNTYYWQVRSNNIDGATEADVGDWWSFATPVQSFADVPVTHWAWSYIERLYAAGITGGCASSPLRYCPNNPVTRSEMAIFLERGMHGSAYTPPAATGMVFADIPVSYWAAAWIEQLNAEGITGGCGGGNYCPGQPVTRAEMAIFLVRAFDLP